MNRQAEPIKEEPQANRRASTPKEKKQKTKGAAEPARKKHDQSQTAAKKPCNPTAKTSLT